MIKRVNLIEKKAFSFTYLKLVQICLVVVAINVLAVGFQSLNQKRLEKKLGAEKIALKKLEVKRDQLMKKPGQKRISVGQYQDLLDRIQNTPKWSYLLTEVSEKLPNTVWITNFKTGMSTSSSPAVKNNQKSKSFRESQKDNKNSSQSVTKISSKHSLEVNGLGSDMRNITEFTSNLSKSKHFVNLILSESSKEAFGFSFKITSEINNNVR